MKMCLEEILCYKKYIYNYIKKVKCIDNCNSIFSSLTVNKIYTVIYIEENNYNRKDFYIVNDENEIFYYSEKLFKDVEFEDIKDKLIPFRHRINGLKLYKSVLDTSIGYMSKENIKSIKELEKEIRLSENKLEELEKEERTIKLKIKEQEIKQGNTLYKIGEKVYAIYFYRIYGALVRWSVKKPQKIKDIKFKDGDIKYILKDGFDYTEYEIFTDYKSAYERCTYLTNNHII